MRSFGAVLKEERERHNFTINQLEKETKIKKAYLSALENHQWEQLPEYPIVVGFVRLISSQLGVKQNNLVALLRRDYPPTNLTKKITPPREVFLKGVTPKVWGIIVALMFLLMGIGYITYQYIDYNRNPKLILTAPLEDTSVKINTKINIEGQTDADASVFFNNQALYIDKEGIFKTEYIIAETTTILVRAVSRAGKETEVKREVVVVK